MRSLDLDADRKLVRNVKLRTELPNVRFVNERNVILRI